MLILSLTTDKLSLITSSAAPIDVVTSFVDRNQTTGIVGLAEKQLTAIVTAATTDIVAVPGATTTRNIKTLHIRNKHTFSNNVVVVQYNANGTLYEIYRANLLAGECLEYIDGVGFFLLPNVTRLERSMYLRDDQAFATAGVFADITGLTCPMVSGHTYNFLCHVFHQTNATTTGAQFGVNIGAAPTFLQVAMIDTVTASVQAAVMSYGATQGLDAAIITQTTGAVGIVMGIMTGVIVPSADGTFAIRARSEVTVANGLIVVRGSWLRVWEPTS